MVSSRLTDYRYRGSLARQAGNAPERRAPRGEAGATTFEHRSTWPTSRKRNATAQAVEGNLGGFCVRNAQPTFVFGGSSPRSNSFLDAFQIDISGTVRGYVIDAEVASGSGVEAVTRQRVYSSDWRKEAGDEQDEPLPVEACRLAAPLERCEPEPLHLVEEPPQARVVTRDSEEAECERCGLILEPHKQKDRPSAT
jgi:hypothetical protein